MQAELALAAYAVLARGVPDPQRLRDADMSESQAVRFSASWTVIDQFTDPSSGVSATIFQKGSQRYLAIRGTEPAANDILVDGILALGFAAKLNPQFDALKTQIDKWLADSAMLKDQTFTVSGHSLGGYLAAAVKQQYGAKVTDAYLFNAPGSGGLVGNIVDLLSGVFGQSIPGANGIWNIKASEGASFSTGLGGQPSAAIPIQIEEAPGAGFGNHSIVPLTDALAVQALYSKLGPNLSQDQLNALVDASGNTMNRTLESALDALRVILLGSDATPTPWAADASSRDVFYTNLYNLKNDVHYTQLVGNSTINPITEIKKATDMASAAQDDIAVRYALKALNPFALVGANYSAFNVGGALDATKGVRDEIVFQRLAHAVTQPN